MYFFCSREAPTLRNVAGDVHDEDGRNRRRRARLGARHQSLMRPRSGSPGIEAHAANAGAHLPSAFCRSLLNIALLPPSYRLQELFYTTI